MTKRGRRGRSPGGGGGGGWRGGWISAAGSAGGSSSDALLSQSLLPGQVWCPNALAPVPYPLAVPSLQSLGCQAPFLGHFCFPDREEQFSGHSDPAITFPWALARCAGAERGSCCGAAGAQECPSSQDEEFPFPGTWPCCFPVSG